MSNVLMTFLYILLFIVCLSLLIMIHELGHFTAAKIFKVYVQEYSIGFGPAFFHKKRKNGETYFSLRVIPFGGYVSMYGEGVELEDGVQVDESRSLEGIKKWKRAIIMVAGVTMNAVLALNIFFVYNVAFSETSCYFNMATITENSIAYESGLRTGQIIAMDEYLSSNNKEYDDNLHLLDTSSVVTLTDSSTVNVYTYLDTSKFTNFKDENLVFAKYVEFFRTKTDGETTTVDLSDAGRVTTDANFVNVKLNIKTFKTDEDGKIIKDAELDNHELIAVSDNGSLQDIGYSLFKHTEPPLSFFKAIGQAFVDFGHSSTVIVRAFATLFSKDTWKSVGGIVAIGFETTSVLQNFGWGRFIYIWGVLSVNLAIVNLLPFPGLDGWQLLVLAVEGISKKKIPNKVKTIVSIVGLALLFTLMAVILVKDLITYVF